MEKDRTTNATQEVTKTAKTVLMVLHVISWLTVEGGMGGGVECVGDMEQLTI